MVKSRQFPPPKTSCTLCLDCCEHSPSQTLHRKAQPRSCAPCSITQPSALYHRRLTAASGGRRRPLSYQCRVELLLNQVRSFTENFRLHILIFPTCDFNRSSVAQDSIWCCSRKPQSCAILSGLCVHLLHGNKARMHQNLHQNTSRNHKER